LLLASFSKVLSILMVAARKGYLEDGPLRLKAKKRLLRELKLNF
jgi:hypothetical protein